MTTRAEGRGTGGARAHASARRRGDEASRGALGARLLEPSSDPGAPTPLTGGRAFAGLLAGVALLAAAAPAAAQAGGSSPAATRPLSEGVTLSTNDPCLSREEFLPHVALWLRGDRIDARLSVLVESAGDRVAFVVMHDGRARSARRFDSLPDACPDRRAAVALALAIAIDAQVLEALLSGQASGGSAPGAQRAPSAPRPRRPRAGATNPATTEPVSDPVGDAAGDPAGDLAGAPAANLSGTLTPEPWPARAPDARAPAVPDDGPPGVTLELVVEGQLLLAVLPEVAGGALVGARIGLVDSVEIVLSGMASSVSGAALLDGGVDAQLLGGRLDLCARRPVAQALSLRGCGGLAAGVAIGRGRDLAAAREVMVPFVAAMARFGLSWWWTEWLSFEAAVEGWVPLLRPRFDVAGGDGQPVASASLPPVGGAVSMGLAVRF